ncbi:hypothetical protein KSP39_PZI001272 [Platanthera zijinensis]|uniref:Uncharacterized protein n=1 Tax=Platanthera zijinensis TaxID=2320716 RepID=A0AAP0C3S5_9ASPA
MAAALGILLVCSPFSTHTPSRRLLLNPRGARRFPTICLRSPSSSPHLPSEGTIDSPSSSSTTVQAAGDRFLDATTHAEERHGYKLASDSSGSPAVRVTPSAESTIEKTYSSPLDGCVQSKRRCKQISGLDLKSLGCLRTD